MKIKALELRNVRGFKELTKTIFSDKINVFIGANNSGKSTILNSIFLMKRQGIFTPSDITIGQVEGEVKLFVEGDYKGIV